MTKPIFQNERFLFTEATIGGVLLKKSIHNNFAKFTGKHLCHLFNKLAGLMPATLLIRRPWQRRFPVNFAKFLRTPFSQITSGRLLFSIQTIIVFYSQLGSGLSPKICLYFQGFWSSKLLNGFLVV